jgi:hypothetical protein
MSTPAVIRVLPLLALLLGALAALPHDLASQVGTTTDIITGRVLGPVGEPLSGASVSAISVETGVRRSTVSNAQGRYTIVFPDGGGRYQLEAVFLGMAPIRRAVARMADEDVLVADIEMDVSPITLEGLEVTTRRGAGPGQREPGTQERVLAGEALNRLPIDPLDPASIALLAPGVVGVDGDTLGLGFSVFGQGPMLNQITVDGISFGAEGMGGGLGLPQEAVRFTRVITNTYDVARGQFSGGQIATTTRAGTNRIQGSFNYQLRDPALQWTGGDDPFAGGFRQNRLSGGLGGPIIRDRLFYFGSFAVQRRSEGLQSLTSADPVSLQRLGAHPDSVARFFSLLGQQGIYTVGSEPVAADRVGDAVTFLGRLDYNLTANHTLTLRGDGRLFNQDPFRVGALNLPQTGGEMETTGGGGMLTLTSRFGGGLVNELRAYYSGQQRDIQPYFQMPEGRVRVTSDLDDGARSVSTLVFGGGSLGVAASDRTLEVSNELSWLRGSTHRIRLGGLFNTTATTQQIASNPYGSFTFNSLADFEANLPSAFSRSLSLRERESGGYNAALYLADTWRPRQPLQITYGVRLEGSGVAQQPTYNREVEDLFGLRTDAIPSEIHLSPRVGFSYTIGAREGAPPTGVLRGGFGEFRSRPPFSLFGSARDATGLPDAQVQLSCIGAATPTPDWQGYATGATPFPETCDDGRFLAQASGRAPGVTVFDPAFAAPRSWRASLGFQRRVLQFLGVSLDATYAQGVSLTGVRDLNLIDAPRFTLGQEDGRPVFVAPGAIDARTGQVGFFDSRVHPQLGSVLEMHSELRSRTTQLTLGLNGFVPQWRMFFQGSYTLGHSRDQGSGAGGWGGSGGGFGGQMGGFGGAGGASASLPSTAGHPNTPDWAASDFDRRHMLNLTLGRQVRPWLDVTAIGRATSGAPFTPLVGGDINGDGARNDRAFLFDPAATADPAVRAAMARLIDAAPGRVQECLAGQLGTIAERNSCRGPWNYTLDFRANLRPEIPNLGRRLTISVDAVNSLAGIDRLLHGTDGLRGWGQNNRPDPVLLYPRGFDPAAQGFVYEVNERFGTPRQGNLAFRNPFQLQVQGQFAIGRVQQGMGGMMGPGGRGGRGGGWTGGGAPGAAQGAGPGGVDPAAMLARAFPNPAAQILEMREALRLTPEQVARLQVVADTLQVRQDAMRATIQEQVGDRGRGGDPAETFRRLQPRLAEARAHTDEALREAEAILTPEQWASVPAEIKNPPRRELRGGGGRP